MLDPQTDRERMVRRLRRDGIADERVLAAMAEVPRDRFVPDKVQYDAYSDRPLPIGCGQTISAPWIVAIMTAALDLTADAVALEVGTGAGYGAAVLSRCCASVVSVERHGELAERARALLSDLGYDNVEVRVGDGTLGAPDCAPFDAVAVTAMAPGHPPSALLEQLARDGVLVCPVGHASRGDLLRIKAGREETLAPVAFVPLVTGGEP